jgi:hypothetical protein
MVRELDLLAWSRKDHAVVADDVTAPNDAETDRAGRPGAGGTLPHVHRRRVEGRASPLRHRPAETESSATGRVHLVAVVRLDDLGDVA